MNTALEYSTRVVQEGGRRCKKSTLNDLVHLTPLRIPLMNPPHGYVPSEHVFVGDQESIPSPGGQVYEDSICRTPARQDTIGCWNRFLDSINVYKYGLRDVSHDNSIMRHVSVRPMGDREPVLLIGEKSWIFGHTIIQLFSNNRPWKNRIAVTHRPLFSVYF